MIGVVAREEELQGSIYEVIGKSCFKYLRGKCSFIGIISIDNSIDINVLNLCDGIILTGGNDIYDYHFKIVDYCINNNIPVLGICMGNQILGLYSFNGNDSDLVPVKGHHMTNHEIEIVKNSVLYRLFGDRMIVNSRHKYALPKDKVRYKIGAKCNEVIEGVEDINNNHFLLGVGWHPEDMDNMEGLFNYFLKEVLVRKLNKKIDNNN